MNQIPNPLYSFDDKVVKDDNGKWFVPSRKKKFYLKDCLKDYQKSRGWSTLNLDRAMLLLTKSKSAKSQKIVNALEKILQLREQEVKIYEGLLSS